MKHPFEVRMVQREQARRRSLKRKKPEIIVGQVRMAFVPGTPLIGFAEFNWDVFPTARRQ